MELPTRADMEEIEISSRLYSEDGGVFMTALVLSQADSDRPVADVVTFVLARDKLVTIRYIDPQPFRTFAARCERTMVIAPKAEGVLNALLDVIVDRMADVLERVGADVEAISRESSIRTARSPGQPGLSERAAPAWRQARHDRQNARMPAHARSHDHVPRHRR